MSLDFEINCVRNNWFSKFALIKARGYVKYDSTQPYYCGTGLRPFQLSGAISHALSFVISFYSIMNSNMPMGILGAIGSSICILSDLKQILAPMPSLSNVMHQVGVQAIEKSKTKF